MAHQQLLPVTKVLDGLGSSREMTLRLPKLTALCENILGVRGRISKPKAGGTRGAFVVHFTTGVLVQVWFKKKKSFMKCIICAIL